MKSSEISQLANSLTPGNTITPVILETHISWVILAGAFAYKIKKPVRFTFLDFSTQEKRKFFCERELTLNRRLAPVMYLQVIPVVKQNGNVFLGPGKGRVVDHALLMKRMDPEKEMDRLLVTGQISEQAIKSLANKLAAFHKNATVIQQLPEIATIMTQFNDLQSVQAFAGRFLGSSFATLITNAILASDLFLNQYGHFLTDRGLKGFVRDLHGDLHTGNIFLYDDPVIFDCIEFNDALREIDILDEVAFLCMDLEAHGQNALGELFFQEYSRLLDLPQSSKVTTLFIYYKCYRANVRAKVLLLRARDSKDQRIFASSIKFAARYLKLIAVYLSKLMVDVQKNHTIQPM